MADFDSPEEKQRWEARAATETQLRQKLRKDRARISQHLEAVERRLKDGTERPDDLEMLRVLQGFFRCSLRQIELHDIDSDTLLPTEHAVLAAMEMGGLEVMHHMTQLQQLNLDALHRLFESDWAAAQAGDPPAAPVPDVWLKLRASAAKQPAWVEAVRRFQEDYPAYRESVQITASLFTRIEEMPAGQARLQALKELNLPAIRGMHFRLESLFRPLPSGEAVLHSVRRYVLEADSATAVVDEVPPGQKRSLTDRLFKMFKA